LSGGQHTGAAAQIRADDVEYVTLLIGTNDFNPYMVGAYGAIYNQTTPFTGAGGGVYHSVEEYIDSIIDRYTVALDTVNNAGAMVVMGTIADFGSSPRVVADFPDPARRENVTNVVVELNNRLKTLASARGLPTVDAYELCNLYLTTGSLVIGDVKIIKAVPPSPNAQYFLLPDAVHPGTVWQGLLANSIIEALNRAYDADFTPLSDQEILSEAGIQPGGEHTFFNISPFVIDPVEPALPDFVRDGVIDLRDFAGIAQLWKLYEPRIDVAPAPYGNGIVDLYDLAVFAEYWLFDSSLVAHWNLDETEGGVAQDSVADNDGMLNGNPIWQPQGGKIVGALQFDGIDDYISTPFILDPAAGAFSVFAWIKGSATGHVILSQVNGMNWLLTDAGEGRLMTELTIAGRFGQPLISQTIVTDDDWHRVGLTWDGKNRTLFVDDVEAAKDTHGTLAGSTEGLYIGAGKNLESGSFWFGLIDDIKIYDRAVTP
jgi:hypothetical protein